MTMSSAPARLGRLDAHAVVRRAGFTLDAVISAEPGEVVAVLGPNGAGKSTLLAVLAGLVVPDTGHVTLDGRMLTGPAGLVPPEQRRIGLMGQDPLLFPHLSAVDNIAFGPRSQGVARREAARTGAAWLDRLHLAEFADRRPGQLSGGQRARVALARALAARPDLLLLDEPLAALDAQTAPELRQALRTHLAASGTTTVLVTHDVLDAATLADRVLVLTDGAVIDSGPTGRVLAAPRSEFTAALAGVNMVTGMTSSAASAGAPAAVAGTGMSLSGLAAEPVQAHAPAMAVFGPAAVSVFLQPAGPGSPRNHWAATVTGLEAGPSTIRVRARVADSPVTVAAELTAAAVTELGLAPGTEVYLSVKATEVTIHAANAANAMNAVNTTSGERATTSEPPREGTQ